MENDSTPELPVEMYLEMYRNIGINNVADLFFINKSSYAAGKIYAADWLRQMGYAGSPSNYLVHWHIDSPFVQLYSADATLEEKVAVLLQVTGSPTRDRVEQLMAKYNPVDVALAMQKYENQTDRTHKILPGAWKISFVYEDIDGEEIPPMYDTFVTSTVLFPRVMESAEAAIERLRQNLSQANWETKFEDRDTFKKWVFTDESGSQLLIRFTLLETDILFKAEIKRALDDMGDQRTSIYSDVISVRMLCYPVTIVDSFGTNLTDPNFDRFELFDNWIFNPVCPLKGRPITLKWLRYQESH